MRTRAMHISNQEPAIIVGYRWWAVPTLPYWYTFESVEPDKVFNQEREECFRSELARRNENIDLIRDVANAHKHLKLTIGNPAITNADQTHTRKSGWGQDYGMCFGGGELLVIDLDDGTEKYFFCVAKSAYEYWELKLQEL
jgi:hypothetical protein